MNEGTRSWHVRVLISPAFVGQTLSGVSEYVTRTAEHGSLSVVKLDVPYHGMERILVPAEHVTYWRKEDGNAAEFLG